MSAREDGYFSQIGVSAIFAYAAPGTFGGSPITVITTDFGFRDW